MIETKDESSDLIVLQPGQFAGTILALQLVLLLAAMDQTIVATAMPRIVSQLGGFDRYAWATTSYLLTSTIAVPLLGRLSDNWGRKSLLLISVAIFAVASVLCGLAGWIPADPMNTLIASRIIQGIGGGGIVALSFAVIGDILAPADRGRYQGHFAAVFALASIAGPTVGGWVADNVSWRVLFFINVPVALLAMLAFYFAFPQQQFRSFENSPDSRTGSKSNKKQMDWWGMACFVVLFTSLLLGLSLPGQAKGTALAFILLSLLLFPIFLRIELGAPHPLMPFNLFRLPVVAISSLSLFVTGIGMFGSILLVPLFLQSVEGVSAAFSGLLLTPLILMVAAASVISGLVMSSKKSYKALVLLGLSLMTAGTFMLSSLTVSSPLYLVLINMLVVGAGLGILLPIYTIVIQNAVPQDALGTVTGFSQFFRSVGGTFGVAAFGSLMLESYQQKLSTLLHSLNFPNGKEWLTPAVLAALSRPLESKKLELALLPLVNNSHDTTDAIIKCVKSALVSSIDGVFFYYGAALAVTLLISLGLEDKPLREANASSAPPQTP